MSVASTPHATAEAHPVLLFDGVCNLCHAAVTFIIDRDPDAIFRFAALQSDAGRGILAAHGYPPIEGDPTTILLLEEGQLFDRSTAALRIAKRLRGAIRILGFFLFLPRPIRDAVYAFIARHRYGWFGKSDSCRLPTPELRSRFL